MRNLICLNKEKYKGTSLAFAAAHEYAHHVQYSKDRFGDLNTLRSELQADCFAGIILATIPGISFNNDEIDKMFNPLSHIGSSGEIVDNAIKLANNYISD